MKVLDKYKNESVIPISHIQIYFSEKGWNTNEAVEFYKYYSCQKWPYLSNWKAAAFRWILKLTMGKIKKKSDEGKTTY